MPRSVWIAGAFVGSILLAAVVWCRVDRATNQPDYLVRQARAALERGNRVRAQDLAQRLQELGHSNELHLLRGEVQLAAARQSVNPEATLTPAQREPFRRALHNFAQVQDAGTTGAEATVLAAECLVRLDQRPLAIEALSLLASARPECVDAQRLLAALFLDLVDAEHAERHLQNWARLEPENARPWRLIAGLRRDFLHVPEAVAAYEATLARKLDDATRVEVILEFVDLLLDQQGQYEKALQLLNQCPPAARQQPAHRQLQAAAFWGLGQSKEASAILDELLRQPDPPGEALLLRARIHLAQDEPAEAVPLLLKALARDAHDQKSRQDLMQAYQLLKQPDLAAEQRKCLDETLRLKATVVKLTRESQQRLFDADLRCRLALLCQQLNLRPEARSWARAALACDPENAQARRLVAELEPSTVAPAGSRPASLP